MYMKNEHLTHEYKIKRTFNTQTFNTQVVHVHIKRTFNTQDKTNTNIQDKTNI